MSAEATGPVEAGATPAPRRRLAAVAALVLGLAAIGAAITFAFEHFPEGPLALVAVVIAAAFAWIAITRRGPTRGISTGVAAVLLVAALVLLVGEGALITAALFVVLLAGSAACARVGMGADQRSLRAAQTPGLPVPPARKPVLIMNPWSGDGTVERTGLVEEARRRGIEPVVLARGDDLTQLAITALDGGADVIGMAGGDGSQALVAALAAERDIPYVCIPAGTRNHLALDLGVDREDVIGALDAFADGVERRIDLATVNGRVFVNNVSLGIYATIVQEDSYRGAKLGTAARLLPELVGPEAAPFDLQFTGPTGADHSTAHVILVSNNPYSFDPFGGFGSRPTLSGGKLGITVTALLDPAESLRAIGSSSGDRTRPSRLEWTADTFDVGSSAAIAAGVDGEAMQFESPLHFEIRPGVLRVRVAPGHPGLSPAAARQAVTRSPVIALARVAAGRSA